MKRAVTIITGIILITGMMSGCVGNQSGTSPSQTTQPTTQASPQSPAGTQSFIGEERAGEIALENAGLTADSVIFDRVELDIDNGVWQYEVEFRQGITEYDADIKADDGTILTWEVSND